MSELSCPSVASHDTDSHLQSVFYYDRLMPCCGNPIKYYKGPEGGMSINIKCAHCSSTWNICPEARYIELIDNA